MQLLISLNVTLLLANAGCSSTPDGQRTERPAPPGPRLTDAAQRDYFTLRERISAITGQVNYLQDYIRQQCM